MTMKKRTKRIDCEAVTRLENHVKAWINKRAPDYPESGAAGVLKDLFHGGCASGYVSHLIYYTDTVKFFKRYALDISALLNEACENCGGGPAQVFGDKWDNSDPLASEESNQNILAWFGFEEAARSLAYRAEIDA